MSDDKQDYHNKGEQDAAAGHDSMRPHGIERLITHFFTSEETKTKQNAEKKTNKIVCEEWLTIQEESTENTKNILPKKLQELLINS